ncbi:hypothetical protein BJ742DRAFT_831679 [Cladochytrium replicatum]|nr:hypothetical protein BJ742DRAFT_831679 [Cladochytrium replicatum]
MASRLADCPRVEALLDRSSPSSTLVGTLAQNIDVPPLPDSAPKKPASKVASRTSTAVSSFVRRCFIKLSKKAFSPGSDTDQHGSRLERGFRDGKTFSGPRWDPHGWWRFTLNSSKREKREKRENITTNVISDWGSRTDVESEKSQSLRVYSFWRMPSPSMRVDRNSELIQRSPSATQSASEASSGRTAVTVPDQQRPLSVLLCDLARRASRSLSQAAAEVDGVRRRSTLFGSRSSKENDVPNEAEETDGVEVRQHGRFTVIRQVSACSKPVTATDTEAVDVIKATMTAEFRRAFVEPSAAALEAATKRLSKVQRRKVLRRQRYTTTSDTVDIDQVPYSHRNHRIPRRRRKVFIPRDNHCSQEPEIHKATEEITRSFSDSMFSRVPTVSSITTATATVVSQSGRKFTIEWSTSRRSATSNGGDDGGTIDCIGVRSSESFHRKSVSRESADVIRNVIMRQGSVFGEPENEENEDDGLWMSP